jgi:hypothetical protein
MRFTNGPVRLDMDYERLASVSGGNPTQAVRNWVNAFFMNLGRVQIERVRLIDE